MTLFKTVWHQFLLLFAQEASKRSGKSTLINVLYRNKWRTEPYIVGTRRQCYLFPILIILHLINFFRAFIWCSLKLCSFYECIFFLYWLFSIIIKMYVFRVQCAQKWSDIHLVLHIHKFQSVPIASTCETFLNTLYKRTYY